MLVLFPDPTLKRENGSGDIGTFSHPQVHLSFSILHVAYFFGCAIETERNLHGNKARLKLIYSISKSD